MARHDLPHIKAIEANIRGLEKAQKTHLHLCPKCRQAKALQNNLLFCDDGWQWAKDLHRERRALDRARGDDAGQLTGQTALW